MPRIHVGRVIKREETNSHFEIHTLGAGQFSENYSANTQAKGSNPKSFFGLAILHCRVAISFSLNGNMRIIASARQ